MAAYELDFGKGGKTQVQALREYGQAKPTEFDYRKIDGTSLQVADETTATLVAPFPINFGNGAFEFLRVHSNGTISLTNPFPGGWYFNELLPTAGLSTLIAPSWDDLVGILGSESNIFVQVQGKAPKRELIVEWRNMRLFMCRGNATATVTFQVVFFESSSDLLFNYGDGAFGGYCSYGALIGVQVSSAAGTHYDDSLDSKNFALLWKTE